MTPAVLAGLASVLALAAGIIAVLVRPREPWAIDDTPERFRTLRRAYERELRALKDLEFDFQAGTLSEEEHAELKAEYKARAVALRKAMERSRLSAVRRIAAGMTAAPEGGEREAIERLVREARAAKGKELSEI